MSSIPPRVVPTMKVNPFEPVPNEVALVSSATS
jgi:hypothetical protein